MSGCRVDWRSGRGFTLVEMMIVVAIVAILAGIAYPSYSDYVMRGRITEATTALQETRVRMEQHFLDNRTYAPATAVATGWTASSCGIPGPGGGAFTYSCAATATTYTITATGAANGMTGFGYTINETNTRATTALPSGWGTAPATCWAQKRGGIC
jgi:type IV pilus assembly protein PilE